MHLKKVSAKLWLMCVGFNMSNHPIQEMGGVGVGGDTTVNFILVNMLIVMCYIWMYKTKTKSDVESLGPDNIMKCIYENGKKMAEKGASILPILFPTPCQSEKLS